MFFGKKLLHIFCMIYNFTIAITEIHITICEVQSDNSNHAISQSVTGILIAFSTQLCKSKSTPSPQCDS